MRCLFTKVKHLSGLVGAVLALSTFTSTKVNGQCYPLPIAPGLTINCGQTAGLYATGAGSNFLWYDVPTGGVPLDTGNMYLTPVLTQNKTYYVETNNLVITRDTFRYIGARDTFFTVPAGIFRLDIDMYGAQGASGNTTPFTDGGLGGRVRFSMPVTPGNTYILNVGGRGNGNLGGYNGGGGCPITCASNNAHGGGGASDFRTTVNVNDRIAVAGGGGGAGFFGSGVNAQGGAGGGLFSADAIGSNATLVGKGATSSSGGAAGTGNGVGTGVLFQGGGFPTTSITTNYGGGGGGYYGGGAGYFSGVNGGGGGGGSSYTDPAFYNISHNQGVRQGDGLIIISYATVTCSSNRLPVPVSVNQNIVTPIVSGVSVMCGDTAELVATGSAGLFQWFDSYSSTTPIATGSAFHYGPMMADKTFYVRSVDNYSNPVCASNKVAVLVETYPIPKPIAAAIINVQCGSSTTLTASGSTGNYWWYDASTGGNYLGTGASFSTPSLLRDTTFYYVEGISSAYPYVLDSVEFGFTGGIQSWTVPFGVDSIDVDVFGAAGGTSTTTVGGLGGRVKAKVPVTPGQTLYIGVGGTTVATTGGYNGGGNGVGTNARGGGGASDIRLVASTPTSASDLLVIAGGGGGAGFHTSYPTQGYGGAGGDSIGGNGETFSATKSYAGQGGTQTAGGAGYTSTYNGNFFNGGLGYSSSSGTYRAGGGGGGYYGGGGGYSNATSYTAGGGGGSSYTTPEASNVQHNQGVNTGNGKVVIYYPRLVTYCSGERTKIGVVTTQLPTPSAINDTVTCADNATIGVSGSTGNYRWFKNANDLTDVYTGSSLSLTNLKNDTTFYVEAVDAPVQSFSQTFSFTSSTQTWTVPNDVYQVEVELLGAQGGTNSNARGGYGAKVSGILQVTPGQTLYINVGQQPTSTTGGVSGAESSGGNGTSSGRGGGGASDIRLNGTSLNDRVIVAGAGGGAAYNYNTIDERGGAAGGAGNAESGYHYINVQNSSNVGGGASQTQGGLGATSNGLPNKNGTFGLGGFAQTNSTGGGGGGWYGGGGGYNYGGGGGGSSYADPNLVSDIVYVDGITQEHQGNGQVIIKYNAPFCASNRVPVHVVVNNIADPVIQPVTVNCGDSAVLNVTSNYPVKWFRNITDNTPFVEGPSVVTSKKYTNDTLYVQTYREYYTQGNNNSTVTNQFYYTGLTETFVVPDGVYELDLELVGAQGGSYSTSIRGGYGAKVTGKMNVTPGQILYINVGEKPTSSSPAFNGGGNGFGNNGRAGGGASDIRINGTTLNDRVIAAGAGGGNGWYSSTSYVNRGGNGGQVGNDNSTAAEGGCYSSSPNSAMGGQGATATYAGGGNTSSPSGLSGQLGRGGNAVNGTNGGGGGGGWYGGGAGGSTYGGGGGGGSSYADPSFISDIIYTHGGTTGHADHGYVTIRYAQPVYNICESNRVPYIILVDSLQAPVVSGNTTICNQGSTTFTATGGVGTYNWYENNQLVASTPSYNTGNRTTSASVKVNYVSAQGCVSSFANGQLNIVNLPAATITSAPAAVCNSTDSIVLNVVNTGGTWSGSGVNASGVFKPATATIGANQVIYSIFDAVSGCYNNDTVSITVDNYVAASITSLAQLVCKSVPSFNLTAVNPGGNWTGNGITNALTGEFSPTTAGVGNHKLYYEQVNGLCTSKDSVTITVTAIPTVQITNNPAQMCLSTAPIQLAANVTNGIWSGNGVSNTGVFNPLNASVGTHTVYYEIASNGCIVKDSVFIQVISAPIAQITTPAQQLCISSSPLALQASPAGGNWTGTGVTAGNFYAANVTPGIYPVYYQVASGGCSSIDTVLLEVVGYPNAAIVTPSAVCANVNSVQLTAVQAGGLWSGNFVSATGVLNVQTAGVGTHRVYYSVANTACTSLDSVDVTVYALPTVSITSSSSQLCSNAPTTQFTASPNGGIWTGAGIVNTYNGTFSPASATVGNHQVYYTYTSANGCVAADTLNVQVSSFPTANFVVDNGCVNTNVNFTDVSTNTLGAVVDWNWNFGNGTTSNVQHPAALYTQAGTYIVTLEVATAAGCTGTITKTVQVGNVPDASFSSVLLNDFTTVNFYPVNPEIGANFLWTFGDGYSATTINTSHTYELADVYTVCLTVEKNGCSTKECNDITTTRNLSIDDEKEVSFNVYPNPFVDQVNIQIKQTNAEKVMVSLYDITGRMIIAPRLISNGVGEQIFSLPLDQYNLSDGAYNLVIHVDGVAFSSLLIKK